MPKTFKNFAKSGHTGLESRSDYAALQNIN